jgi:NADH:ubiquinone oxidoreductase subunit E
MPSSCLGCCDRGPVAVRFGKSYTSESLVFGGLGRSLSGTP